MIRPCRNCWNTRHQRQGVESSRLRRRHDEFETLAAGRSSAELPRLEIAHTDALRRAAVRRQAARRGAPAPFGAKVRRQVARKSAETIAHRLSSVQRQLAPGHALQSQLEAQPADGLCLFRRFLLSLITLNQSSIRFNSLLLVKDPFYVDGSIIDQFD